MRLNEFKSFLLAKLIIYITKKRLSNFYDLIVLFILYVFSKSFMQLSLHHYFAHYH